MPSDVPIFWWVNGWPDQWEAFFRFWSEATQRDWVRWALLAMLVAMIARGSRSRKAILLAMVAWPIANEMCDLAKAWFQGPRPFQVLDDVVMRAGKADSFGTASAHSANMGAIATVLTLGLGRWGWIWIGIALLTGISRIYVGVHFPLQVLFGWSLGALAGFLVWRGWNLIERRIAARRSNVGVRDEPETAEAT